MIQYIDALYVKLYYPRYIVSDMLKIAKRYLFTNQMRKEYKKLWTNICFPILL